jgi:HEAT repeat protein
MSKTHAVVVAAMAMAIAGPSRGQDVPSKATTAQLIATLQSDASQKEKADACRQLALAGTKDAVPALASLLSDEKLAHMARYALEPIPDPAVDEAFRDALGGLRGRLRVGVICSIGVRRDRTAAPALAKLVQDPDAEAAQAAARALGALGTSDAAKALQDALAGAPAANQLALCEGLFRCAAALAAQGLSDEAAAIYDRLRSLPGPHQVRAGALCAAILVRQKEGLSLLAQHLRSQDYVLFAAAIRAAQQSPGSEATAVLTGALSQSPVDRQIVIMQTLGKRGDPAALPALTKLAKASAKPVRLAALCALAELGQAQALPAMLELLAEADRESVEARPGSLAGLRVPIDQRLVVCRQAARLVQRADQKRLLLSVLSSTDSPDALALIVPFVVEGETREEAATAAVSAAERLLKQRDAQQLAAQLVEPLQKVAQAPVPAALAQRAKAALQQAQSIAQKKPTR